MDHVLDNPAWNALVTGNQSLGLGTDDVRFFQADISPFAAFKAGGKGDFAALYKLMPPDAGILFVNPEPLNIHEQWRQLAYIPGLQMVHDTDRDFSSYNFQHELVDLTTENVPEMLELTELTRPGPFSTRTIEFGHYKGIFKNGQLVAMAGQRLNPGNFMEISAVCTRPGHTGCGYARELLICQFNRIKKAGQTPFLHVRDDNERAIRVYHDLGFRTRIPVHFYFLRKRPLIT